MANSTVNFDQKCNRISREIIGFMADRMQIGVSKRLFFLIREQSTVLASGQDALLEVGWYTINSILISPDGEALVFNAEDKEEYVYSRMLTDNLSRAISELE